MVQGWTLVWHQVEPLVSIKTGRKMIEQAMSFVIALAAVKPTSAPETGHDHPHTPGS
jgi:hypothetical protein